VFSIPSPRPGDRKHTTRWIKIITSQSIGDPIYIAFLQRQSRSEQAKAENKRYTEDFEKGKSVVDRALKNIKATELELLETASKISRPNTEKTRLKERKLEIMRKEAELRKEKLRLKAKESIIRLK
jgi:hypothetical protein